MPPALQPVRLQSAATALGAARHLALFCPKQVTALLPPGFMGGGAGRRSAERGRACGADPGGAAGRSAAEADAAGHTALLPLPREELQWRVLVAVMQTVPTNVHALHSAHGRAQGLRSSLDRYQSVVAHNLAVCSDELRWEHAWLRDSAVGMLADLAPAAPARGARL